VRAACNFSRVIWPFFHPFPPCFYVECKAEPDSFFAFFPQSGRTQLSVIRLYPPDLIGLFLAESLMFFFFPDAGGEDDSRCFFLNGTAQTAIGARFVYAAFHDTPIEYLPCPPPNRRKPFVKSSKPHSAGNYSSKDDFRLYFSEESVRAFTSPATCGAPSSLRLMAFGTL